MKIGFETSKNQVTFPALGRVGGVGLRNCSRGKAALERKRRLLEHGCVLVSLLTKTQPCSIKRHLRSRAALALFNNSANLAGLALAGPVN